MPFAALKTKPPPPGAAERAELAAAIAVARDAERVSREAHEAATRAADSVEAAKEALRAAQARLNAAADANVAGFIKGDASRTNAGLIAARADVVDCEDMLAAAKAARDILAEADAGPEGALRRARRAVIVAARKVIAGEAERVLGEARAAEGAFLAKLAELQALASPPLSDEAVTEVTRYLTTFRRYYVPHDWPIGQWLRRAEHHPAADRWRAAVAALEADADAALPT